MGRAAASTYFFGSAGGDGTCFGAGAGVLGGVYPPLCGTSTSGVSLLLLTFFQPVPVSPVAVVAAPAPELTAARSPFFRWVPALYSSAHSPYG